MDQAGALILCSLERARSLGFDETPWRFPVVGADSNHMVPVVARGELTRARGIAEAFAATGIDAESLEVVDLYSCFPIAVALQAREVGLDADRPLTVGGGMAFAGGPFNNAVIQATVRMAERLGDGGPGMVTAVSGMLTKQGLTVWSTAPPAAELSAPGCDGSGGGDDPGARGGRRRRRNRHDRGVHGAL